MDFTYPSVPDGADGMQAVFYLVRDGRCSTREVRLVRPCPERKLRLAWTSFRDRLQPGTEETWRLRVTLPDGRPAPAQLMATLYDTSLDAIKPHGWNFYQHFFPSLPSVRMGMTNWFGSNYIAYAARVPYTVSKPLRFDYFNPAMLAWGSLRTVEEVLNITDNTVVVGMSPGSGRIAGLDSGGTGRRQRGRSCTCGTSCAARTRGDVSHEKTADGVAADGVSQDVVIRENLN